MEGEGEMQHHYPSLDPTLREIDMRPRITRLPICCFTVVLGRHRRRDACHAWKVELEAGLSNPYSSAIVLVEPMASYPMYPSSHYTFSLETQKGKISACMLIGRVDRKTDSTGEVGR
jgi:hypothetical protein